MEPSPEQIAQDMLLLIGRVKQELSGLSERQQLTYVQIGVLCSLARYGELAMGEVAHTLHCDPSNVTGVIDRLVTQQLVTRQECAHDRRAKTISLTSAGRHEAKTVFRSLPERLGYDKLSGHERSALHDIMQKLLAS